MERLSQNTDEEFGYYLEDLQRRYLPKDHLIVDYSLITNEGQFVHVGRIFWKCSKKLQDESAQGKNVEVQADKFTVEIIKTICTTTETVRLSAERFVKLVRLAHELQLDFKGYRKIVESFLESDDFQNRFSESYNFDVVIACFETLCKTVRRSRNVYEIEIGNLKEYCNTNCERMIDVINTLKMAAANYAALELTPLPKDFSCKSVALAVVKENNQYVCKIYHKEQWQIFDVFGKFFNLSINVKDLTLCYGECVLYRTKGNEVMCKRLDCKDNEYVVLTQCESLKTREGEVLALAHNNVGSEIYYWSNGKFISVFKSPYRLEDIDYLPSQYLIGMTFMRNHELVVAFMQLHNPLSYNECGTFTDEDVIEKSIHFYDGVVILYSWPPNKSLSLTYYWLSPCDTTFKLLRWKTQPIAQTDGLFYLIAGLDLLYCAYSSTLTFRNHQNAILNNVVSIQELPLITPLNGSHTT